MLAIAVPLTGVSAVPSLAAVNSNITKENSVVTTQEEVERKEEVEERKEKAELIDNYFKLHNAPLEGYGMKFVLEAEKNEIDWRLLPAIAMIESTGGKQACKRVPNSVFGYGSCKLSFKSIDESIEIVTKSIAGHNPKTAHHYDGKTTLQILRTYNSVIPTYSQKVVKVMKTISNDGKEVI